MADSDEIAPPPAAAPATEAETSAARGLRQSRFADLVRVRLEKRRLLHLDDEKALLAAAVCDLDLRLDDARAILLRLAADQSVLLESRERQRVAEAIRVASRDRKISANELRKAGMLARPWMDAAGERGVDSRVRATEIARAEGVEPAGGLSWLMPRRWFESAQALRGEPADTRRAWHRAY